MNKSVVLHQAFVWDCDHCGRENVEHVITDQEAMPADMPELLAEREEECRPALDEIVEELGEEYQGSEISSGVIVYFVPKCVTCRTCKTKYDCSVQGLTPEPDGESEGE